jgi:hypothetical protein
MELDTPVALSDARVKTNNSGKCVDRNFVGIPPIPLEKRGMGEAPKVLGKTENALRFSEAVKSCPFL